MTDNDYDIVFLAVIGSIIGLVAIAASAHYLCFKDDRKNLTPETDNNSINPLIESSII